MTLTLFDPGFLAATAGGLDPDAAAYIARVEGASGDNQTLEQGVKDAINAFVVGCKADGIWNAIKASCILAGARTLNGALQPLVGTAPTRFGTESGWNYNRKTGLLGNATDNYLNSNRNNTADPQDNRHASVFVSLNALATQTFMGGRPSDNFTGTTGLGFTGSNGRFRSVPNTDTFQDIGTVALNTPTLIGSSRNTSTAYTARISATNHLLNSTSASAASVNNFVFALNNQGSPAVISNARIAFYSIGESLDLALLDARVTTLINAFGSAIP
jgi:hypothetical protein